VFQGCTPNFWRQQNRFGCWPAPYTPDAVVSTVFTIPACLASCTYGGGRDAVNIADLTLDRALGLGNANGAGADLCAKAGYLLREGVAALLNAQNSAVSFPRTAARIIADVNAALATCDPQTIRDLGDQLGAFNSAGCPLNARNCGP
jgi:hypothetical protein